MIALHLPQIGSSYWSVQFWDLGLNAVIATFSSLYKTKLEKVTISAAPPLETARPPTFSAFITITKQCTSLPIFSTVGQCMAEFQLQCPVFFQGEGRLHPDESESCMVRAKCGREMVQSSALNKFVLDFRRVAPFQNEGYWNVTGVKNRGQISNFLTSVKLGKDVS